MATLRLMNQECPLNWRRAGECGVCKSGRGGDITGKEDLEN